jgi:protein phosphatase 1 regulatory subunit 10
LPPLFPHPYSLNAPAAKDLASVLTQKWTNLIAQLKKVDEGDHCHIPVSKTISLTILASMPDSSTPLSSADVKGKKRKAPEPPVSKAPPAKKPTPGANGSTATAGSSSVSTVKKEGAKPEPVTTKAAKSDSSFFSAPKKKVLPSFKKVAVSSNAKKEDTASVSQPLNFNPYQEALKDLATKTSSAAATATQAPTPAPTPPVGAGAGSSGSMDVVGNAGPSSTSVDVNMKPKKSVTFAPDGQLEMIKWISRADYPDDKPEVCRRGAFYMWSELSRHCVRYCRTCIR